MSETFLTPDSDRSSSMSSSYLRLKKIHDSIYSILASVPIGAEVLTDLRIKLGCDDINSNSASPNSRVGEVGEGEKASRSLSDEL